LNNVDHPSSLQFTALVPGKGRTPDGAFAAIENGGRRSRARPKGSQFEVGPANGTSRPRQRLLRMRRCRVYAGLMHFVVLYVRSPWRRADFVDDGFSPVRVPGESLDNDR
jgi:hypothetical protein